MTRVPCDEESFFVCEREQSLRNDLRPFLAKPIAVVPLTRDIGPAEIASNLEVEIHNVGFDFDRKPNFLLGSALLGGDAFVQTGIDVNLRDLIPGDQITVSMWLRSRDVSFGANPQILVVSPLFPTDRRPAVFNSLEAIRTLLDTFKVYSHLSRTKRCF